MLHHKSKGEPNLAPEPAAASGGNRQAERGIASLMIV